MLKIRIRKMSRHKPEKILNAFFHQKYRLYLFQLSVLKPT